MAMGTTCRAPTINGIFRGGLFGIQDNEKLVACSRAWTGLLLRWSQGEYSAVVQN
jgi:hypothetical protein